MSGPQFVRYFVPVIEALEELGGSGRPSEVRTIIVQKLKVSPQDQSATTEGGGVRFDNQIAWARFYLAKAGYIDASKRGVWSLTDKALVTTTKPVSFKDALDIFKQVQSAFGNEHIDETNSAGSILESDNSPAPSGLSISEISSYRVRILEILRALPPSGFERLCQRLLRESGFEQVVVTGRSGDGGIDGFGTLQINAFVSFKVLFQCKRYTKSVTPSEVRDFRGAMTGRTDKGIIMTTGTFTSEAQKEALREGTPPIELVSGEKLVELFESLELGLKPRTTYDVDYHFFEEFQA